MSPQELARIEQAALNNRLDQLPLEILGIVVDHLKSRDIQVLAEAMTPSADYDWAWSSSACYFNWSAPFRESWQGLHIWLFSRYQECGYGPPRW